MTVDPKRAVCSLALPQRPEDILPNRIGLSEVILAQAVAFRLVNSGTFWLPLYEPPRESWRLVGLS